MQGSNDVLKIPFKVFSVTNQHFIYFHVEKMDEEVAAITNNSPLPATHATDSPELKGSSPEDNTGKVTNSIIKEDNVQADQSDSEYLEEEEEKTEEVTNDQQDNAGENDEEEEGEEGLECGLDSGLNEEQMCRACNEKYKQPRILACLHVFCTPCLEKQVEDGDGDYLAERAGLPKDRIKCTQCKQITSLTSKGIEDLPHDTVMTNILDMAAMNDPQIVCTSCKAKEKAVARCNDCASFLCPNCVTAHQYMRCFENHKVRKVKVLP